MTVTSPPPASGEDPASQRQRWRQALAEHGRANRGSRGARFRQRRRGFAAADGPGRVRVRVILPDVVDGQGDETAHTRGGTTP